MNTLKNIINCFSFIILICFLSITNRFIYHYFKPENKINLTYCKNLNCNISWEPTIFTLCLVFFALLMICSYFIYNPITYAFQEEKTIKTFEIKQKEHSSMFWGVICYPLILCPLSEDLILFGATISILILFTFIYLKHLNELVLPPLVIVSGEKLFLLKNDSESFYLLSKKDEDELKKIKNIKCREIKKNIYKEIY